VKIAVVLMKKLLIGLLLLVVGLGIAARLGWIRIAPEGAVFRTQKVTKGEIVVTVSATGTLEPQEVVDVGAQVNGPVVELGPDLLGPDKKHHIDYTSKVKKDSLLARIDPRVYEARLVQAQANLEQAKANVTQAKATLRQAERDWKRTRRLLGGGASSDADYDLALSKYENALAAIDVANAAVSVAEAALKEAHTNVDYTEIKSPVDGVIIERRVNVGQTVVANLSAQSLFLIAKNLDSMEIWASVNEADIGEVCLGQEVSFTVAAYPKRTFHGNVTSIRDNASSTSNVVTYPVVVSFDNSKEKLKPYLTASLQFQVSKKTNVLCVPNAVLRYRPLLLHIAPAFRVEWGERLGSRAPGASEKGPPMREKEPDGREKVPLWVDNGRGFVEPRWVHIGPTDGTRTQIIDGLQDGDDVVWSIDHEKTEKARNPFLPNPAGKKE
jgi:HlyD family secretion protein